MRISREDTPDGAVYLVFRQSPDTEAVKQVLHYAQVGGLNAFLGSTRPGSGCLLTIGPLRGEVDLAFRQRWDEFIEDLPETAYDFTSGSAWPPDGEEQRARQ